MPSRRFLLRFNKFSKLEYMKNRIQAKFKVRISTTCNSDCNNLVDFNSDDQSSLTAAYEFCANYVFSKKVYLVKYPKSLVVIFEDKNWINFLERFNDCLLENDSANLVVFAAGKGAATCSSNLEDLSQLDRKTINGSSFDTHVHLYDQLKRLSTVSSELQASIDRAFLHLPSYNSSLLMSWVLDYYQNTPIFTTQSMEEEDNNSSVIIIEEVKKGDKEIDVITLSDDEESPSTDVFASTSDSVTKNFTLATRGSPSSSCISKQSNFFALPEVSSSRTSRSAVPPRNHFELSFRSSRIISSEAPPSNFFAFPAGSSTISPCAIASSNFFSSPNDLSAKGPCASRSFWTLPSVASSAATTTTSHSLVTSGSATNNLVATTSCFSKNEDVIFEFREPNNLALKPPLYIPLNPMPSDALIKGPKRSVAASRTVGPVQSRRGKVNRFQPYIRPSPRMPMLPVNLRPIVIDGSNIAMEHGKPNSAFSCTGIKICIDFFAERGHKEITAFVPQFRRKAKPNILNQSILEDLGNKQLVVFTPSREVQGRGVSSYDDRFILKLAQSNGGIIVSNDNFRDLTRESEEWKKLVEERLLMYCFVGDRFMIPDDPLGRDGPNLEEYLSF